MPPICGGGTMLPGFERLMAAKVRISGKAIAMATASSMPSLPAIHSPRRIDSRHGGQG